MRGALKRKVCWWLIVLLFRPGRSSAVITLTNQSRQSVLTCFHSWLKEEVLVLSQRSTVAGHHQPRPLCP